MKRVLVVLAACGRSSEPAPPPPSATQIVTDASRVWPLAPAPTLPPELEIAWPPTYDEVLALEAGVPLANDRIAYGSTIPSTFPRVFVTNVDLMTLESAWGTLARDHSHYAVWWNADAHMRARFDVPNPTPSKGRGL